MKTGLYIGRFQPFHEGHRKCIEHILTECDRCIVMIRDTDRNDHNPLSFLEREFLIRSAFPDMKRVEISFVTDDDSDLTVYIGREVGYGLIRLDETTERISGTDLRKELYGTA